MYLLYVCVCWRPERIAPSMDVTAFAAQSARQLLSVHWMRSALSVTHCLVLSDWLAFLLQGKTDVEWGWPLMTRDQPFFSHNVPLELHPQCVGLNFKTQAGCKKPQTKQKRLLIIEKVQLLSFFCVTHSAGFFFLGYSTEAGNVRPSSSHNRFFCLSKGCIQTSSSPSLCR